LLFLQVVAELKETAQPLQLSYQTLSGSQQQQQPAAHQLMPTAALLTVSSTGKWAAVAGASHVHMFDLESRSYHGRLPALQVRRSETASSGGVTGINCFENMSACAVYTHLCMYRGWKQIILTACCCMRTYFDVQMLSE